MKEDLYTLGLILKSKNLSKKSQKIAESLVYDSLKDMVESLGYQVNENQIVPSEDNHH